MITCDKCGFGHKTFEEKRACKSWGEIAAELQNMPKLNEAVAMHSEAPLNCPRKPGEPGGEKASLALEAREWAIKAMCPRCRDGAVAQRVNENDYISNFDAVHRGDWFHLPTLQHDYSYCEADKIHEAIWLERAAEDKALGKPEGRAT